MWKQRDKHWIEYRMMELMELKNNMGWLHTIGSQEIWVCVSRRMSDRLNLS